MSMFVAAGAPHVMLLKTRRGNRDGEITFPARVGGGP